ncbi:MAG: translation initiation factor IF-2 [Bacteroidetes bacterium]|nr:translation initiation factor IF-2 [Bacteroidota bacterium]
MRLSQVARKLNVGTASIISYLEKKGFYIENKPNSKISQEQFKVLENEFAESATDKKEASGVAIGEVYHNLPKQKPKKSFEKKYVTEIPKLQGIKKVGKLDIREKPKPPIKEKISHKNKEEVIKLENIAPKQKKEEKQEKQVEKVELEVEELKGLTVVGKMELPKEIKKQKIKNEVKTKKKFLQVASSDTQSSIKTNKNKNFYKNKSQNRNKNFTKRNLKKPLQPSEKDIKEQIKATLAKLSSKAVESTNRAKYRKEKRAAIAEAKEVKKIEAEKQSKVLNVTEFISTGDLASIMDVTVQEVLAKCLELGILVSINQRLDAETITIIADEFGYDVKFKTLEENTEEEEEKDKPEDLKERAPIVTVMGHVDHGKTSLLDYIRNSEITKGEAGGITQHIGAYDVKTGSGKRVAFLDTPGHEAFTAMRARGAQITDIVIIVVAADDNVMPQTKEAINHAQLANVPMVIAINKIDKPDANPEKIKEELSQINVLVEDWGGKYQCQEISAKTGKGIDELLEKVLLEAELLELKANPNKKAIGSVLEASLDTGRGYLSTFMVQAGTLFMGDTILAGSYFGKVKAMFDHHGNKLKKVLPSTPVQVLGLNGAPQSGDKFKVMDSDKEARDISLKRQQIKREQQIRTKKHITLDEVSKRLALGNFQELKLIIKGDFDGSVEALSDSLLKLSTESIKINIIQKAVGAITDSDVLLASASDAVIIGFQVRPSGSARKLAEKEGIDIRLYSIIYDAINNIKDAMAGMVVPETKEVVLGNAEVREIFKISKIGTIAGCYVTDGIINRNNSVRLIREGIVTYTGNIKQLKRFKNDIQEAKTGFECGISIENFNDIKVGDVIEAFGEENVENKS